VHLVFAREGDLDPTHLVSAIVMPRRGALPADRLALAERFRADSAGELALVSAREDGYDVAAVELADTNLFLVSSRGPRENLELSRAVLPALVTAALAR